MISSGKTNILYENKYLKYANELVYVNILLTIVRILFEIFKSEFQSLITQKWESQSFFYYVYLILDPIINLIYLTNFHYSMVTQEKFEKLSEKK